MIGIFFVTTHWGKNYGGIDSINYNLINGLLQLIQRDKMKEWKLRCIVTEEKLDNEVTGEWEEKGLVILCFKAPEKSKILKRNIEKDHFTQIFFIGHDVITGEIALKLRENYKKTSLCVLFHHMDYSSYYFLREDDPAKIQAKKSKQQEIIPKADIVISIGPLLKESAYDLLLDGRRSNPDEMLFELIPGMEDIVPITSIHKRHTVALFGRIEKENNAVKQIPLALQALAQYTKKKKGMSYKINIYGFSEDRVENQQEVMDTFQKVAKKIIPITACKYIEDRDELKQIISNASLCIMPSYYEGFGLVAYEAIAAGVPVIISRNTGLYRFLLEKKGEEAWTLVESLEIEGNIDNPESPYTKNDLKNMVNCIDNVFSNYELSKKNALRLRNILLKEHYTWDFSTRDFANVLNKYINHTEVKLEEKDDLFSKKSIELQQYILNELFEDYCWSIWDKTKAICKIIKYSDIRDCRLTVLSSDDQLDKKQSDFKVRSINDGTVGIMNSIYTSGGDFPVIISNFIDGKCYCIRENITELDRYNIGVADHHVLAIIAVPLIHDDILEGALTIDIFDNSFIEKFSVGREELCREIYKNVKLLSKILIKLFYYNISDDLNFGEVKRMLRKRELVSFTGRCEFDCKHCFAQEIVEPDERENGVEDVINDLKDKIFDVVYISHNKENFLNPEKGVTLCEKIYENYRCDICVITRTEFTGDPLKRITELNSRMKETRNNLTFCISVPALESSDKIESSEFMPSPEARIRFAKKLKKLGIYSFVTIRPLFPDFVISTSEVHQIVDLCAGEVDAILTGGLCVTDHILQRLGLESSKLKFLASADSEYLQGTDVDFKEVDVRNEIDDLEQYCKSKRIPFFKHSMDALNNFK